jgi:xylose dehydrogenase (NAD/NADP)
MNQANHKLKWGILGAARINRRFLPGLKAAHNAELVAIASRDEGKARQAADQWGAPTAYGSYEALLADPQIEAVYIPLPNNLHVEWATKAARAGKHVLSEKPLALNPQDIQPLEEVARQNKVNVMEAFMYRFHPQQARVRELLAAGAIGQPRVIRGSFAFVMATDTPNIRMNEALGGGATWDVGCYAINVSRWMFGAEPLTAYAQASLKGGVDYNVAAILDFGEDRRAVLDYGLDYGRRSFYEIIGTKGTLSVESMWQEPGPPARVYLRDDNGLTTEELPPVNHFQLEAEAFSQAALDGQPAPYPLSDSAANSRACLAVLASIKEGRQVSVER